MPGIIISIINNKGGTGKTATACNLAHALSRMNQKVLVVDMDPQTNASNILLGKSKTILGLYNLLDPDNKIDVASCITGTPYQDLYILPNIAETAALEPKLIRRAPGTLTILREKLRDYALNNFDFTIIDNPPNLGTFVICSLYCSDFAIVPNEAGSKHSMEGLIKAVSFINDIRKDGNVDLRFLKLLITKVDKRMSACKAIIAQIKKFFPSDKVFETIIPSNSDFQKAELSSKPVYALRTNAPGSIAYTNLAKEILELLSKDI